MNESRELYPASSGEECLRRFPPSRSSGVLDENSEDVAFNFFGTAFRSDWNGPNGPGLYPVKREILRDKYGPKSYALKEWRGDKPWIFRRLLAWARRRCPDSQIVEGDGTIRDLREGECRTWDHRSVMWSEALRMDPDEFTVSQRGRVLLCHELELFRSECWRVGKELAL